MTLTTHSIVGAAVGATMVGFFPKGQTVWAIAVFFIATFLAAFASHFLLDAIPHWDYPINSGFVNPDIASRLDFDKSMMRDIFSIGGDILIGLTLSFLLFALPFWFLIGNGTNMRMPDVGPYLAFFIVMFGALSAILPDALQTVYGHFKYQPLIGLQKFHKWIHTDMRLKQYPKLGILSQAMFLLLFVIISKYFMRHWLGI